MFLHDLEKNEELIIEVGSPATPNTSLIDQVDEEVSFTIYNLY